MFLKKIFNKITGKNSINNYAIVANPKFLYKDIIISSTSTGKSKMLTTLLNATLDKSKSVVIYDPKDCELSKAINLKCIETHTFILMDFYKLSNTQYNPTKFND